MQQRKSGWESVCSINSGRREIVLCISYGLTSYLYKIMEPESRR